MHPMSISETEQRSGELPPAEFHLHRPFQPAGDQPQAIETLTKGFQSGTRAQVLLGATGTGKTFTMANVIANVGRPALVLSHNKTLAAQLYGEFREFFPENAVHYFVSYYDYYQPEAYIPQRDVYIEKDASINEEIDRLRLATTSSLVSRRDVVIVASVSSIYGLGSPKDYKELMVALHKGEVDPPRSFAVEIGRCLYERNDVAFERGKFRVRGDSIEVWPSYEEFAYRIEMWGDEIEQISIIKPVSGETIKTLDQLLHLPGQALCDARGSNPKRASVIREELAEQLEMFQAEANCWKPSGFRRERVLTWKCWPKSGHCPGIENYSRPLSGKPPGRHARHAVRLLSG